MTDSEQKQPENQDISEIFTTYHPEIFRFVAARVRDKELAIDITSDVFIKTFDFLEKNTIEFIRAFLYRVARNLVIDYSRKKKSVSLDAMVDDHNFEARETTEMIDVTHKKMLHDVMSKLSDKYQDILVKRYINELTLEEIADIYSISLNNAAVLCHRALIKAQEEFSKISKQYEYF